MWCQSLLRAAACAFAAAALLGGLRGRLLGRRAAAGLGLGTALVPILAARLDRRAARLIFVTAAHGLVAAAEFGCSRATCAVSCPTCTFLGTTILPHLLLLR